MTVFLILTFSQSKESCREGGQSKEAESPKAHQKAQAPQTYQETQSTKGNQETQGA